MFSFKQIFLGALLICFAVRPPFAYSNELHKAIIDNDLKQTKLILKKNLDVNYLSELYEGLPPLQLAIKLNRIEIIQLLMANPLVSLSQLNEDEEDAFAYIMGHYIGFLNVNLKPVLYLLIKSGKVNLQKKIENKLTALDLAVSYDDYDLALKLLSSNLRLLLSEDRNQKQFNCIDEKLKDLLVKANHLMKSDFINTLKNEIFQEEEASTFLRGNTDGVRGFLDYIQENFLDVTPLIALSSWSSIAKTKQMKAKYAVFSMLDELTVGVKKSDLGFKLCYLYLYQTILEKTHDIDFAKQQTLSMFLLREINPLLADQATDEDLPEIRLHKMNLMNYAKVFQSLVNGRIPSSEVPKYLKFNKEFIDGRSESGKIAKEKLNLLFEALVSLE